jgi:hypothetical protein
MTRKERVMEHTADERREVGQYIHSLRMEFQVICEERRATPLREYARRAQLEQFSLECADEIQAVVRSLDIWRGRSQES